MKFGVRIPSLKRRISARTSWKRVVRHSLGIKAPRGMGFITNPKRALYNKVYNKTSISIDKLINNTGSLKNSSNSRFSTKSTISPSSLKKSTVFNVLIFLVLLVLWYPLAILFIIYKIYKHNKKSPATVTSGRPSFEQQELVPTESANDIISTFKIPEPTKSLLWVTDEDTSKISSPTQIRIVIRQGKGGIESETIDESYGFYSEPSLIWMRLPIERNDNLETEKMYYPTYSGLSPKHRYQYLKWLSDITQDTNLSYVFLYYYGLERHLLVGKYDLAVDEILKLIKHHDKGTFKNYAITALILASGYRKRADIIDKAPFILEELSPISLHLQKMANKALTAKDIISLASRIGFSNKRYIKQYPDLFEKELQQILDEYQSQHGDILQNTDITNTPKQAWASIANVSVPDYIRTAKFSSVLDNSTFKSILKEKLEKTHLKIKQSKHTKRS